MRKLSTGADSTLKEYMRLAKAVFGEDSKAVEYLDNKIKKSAKGEDEEVIADERLILRLLIELHMKGK